MRRVACIALPQIRVEIVRERERERADTPLAIVVARPGGAVRTERDVLGNTRLDVVSREARGQGVRVGQTVAAARAKCADLRVRVVAESAVRTGLARVAEVSLAVGPSSAFDAASDVVWVEIGGCAHLHGGERELALALERRVLALGHACRVAVADGPRLAAAVARFAPAQGRQAALAHPTRSIRHARPPRSPRQTHSSLQAPLIVPEGRGAEAMRALPVEALDLDAECLAWLRDLGLRTCGDLQGLPRRSLGTRLGARTKDVMQLLGGEDRAPLDAWRPPEVPEERVELEWGAASVEALAFVTRALCERLAARLEGRAMAAARIALVLGLDRGLLGDDARPDAATVCHEIALPVPIVRAADLFAVVRARLEHVELPAPAMAVTLRALELSAASARSLDLLTPEPRAARTLPALVAELAADLGPSSVGTLALADTWAPEERTRLAPFGKDALASEHWSEKGPAKRPLASLVTSAMEPSRFVHSTVRITRDERGERGERGESDERTPKKRGAVMLARLEAVEWWRQERQQERNGMERRDFCAVWDGAGLAWAEVRGHEAWLRGWID
jgi:protein ImuB